MASAQFSLFPDESAGADAARRRGCRPRGRHRRPARRAAARRRGALSGSRRPVGADARRQGMPFRWALNPYRGCTHACEYCYARKYQRHLELGAGDDFSSVILVKRNLPEVLRARGHAPRLGARERRGRHGDRSVSADRRPLPADAPVPRGAGRAADTPFSIVTKGPMVVRDIDVLVAGHARGRLSRVRERAERRRGGVGARWNRARRRRCSGCARCGSSLDAGIDAGVLMMPLVPGITTSRASIERTLEAIAEAGVAASLARTSRTSKTACANTSSRFSTREYPALRRRLPAAVSRHLRADQTTSRR